MNYFSGTKKYIDWKNLGYGIDDDFVCHPRTPDYANEDFLNGLGNFGYFPEFSNYRVPINEVRNSMNEMWSTFGDYGTEICTGMPDYDAYYLNGQAMNINNQDFMANQSNGFNHSQQEWTGSKAVVQCGLMFPVYRWLRARSQKAVGRCGLMFPFIIYYLID